MADVQAPRPPQMPQEASQHRDRSPHPPKSNALVDPVRPRHSPECPHVAKRMALSSRAGGFLAAPPSLATSTTRARKVGCSMGGRPRRSRVPREIWGKMDAGERPWGFWRLRVDYGSPRLETPWRKQRLGRSVTPRQNLRPASRRLEIHPRSTLAACHACAGSDSVSEVQVPDASPRCRPRPLRQCRSIHRPRHLFRCLAAAC